MKRTPFLLCFLLVVLTMSAQSDKSRFLHMESNDSEGVTKEIYAPAINLGLPKLKTSYFLIIMPVEDIADTKEIKVILNQESKTELYVIILDINKIDLVKTKKLAAFPFYSAREKIKDESGIIFPVFVLQEVMEDDFPEFMAKYTVKDIEDLRKEMEKQYAQ